MAGIYVHIPFCKQKCTYCDFHFSTSLNTKDEVIGAMVAELIERKDWIQEPIKTIYFGGGTPSFLESEDLKQILDCIHENYSVESDIEVTIEANPDDLDFDTLKELHQIGFNRLSIGIQSFYEPVLKWMNRAHSNDETLKCIELAHEIGFDNISIDLIYGIPGMSDEEWKENISKALALGVQHISAYNLTVEEGTALNHQVNKEGLKMPSDDDCAEQFDILIDELTATGFVHYETSNFGKEGFFSQHNSSYWKGEKYIGIGPSAHSFNGMVRRWNISNNRKYIAGIKDGKYFDFEELSTADKYNEYLLTGLRTMWGCSLDYIESEFGSKVLQDLMLEIRMAPQFYELDGTHFRLSEMGKPLADRLTSNLFLV